MRLKQVSAATLISLVLVVSSCGLLDDDGGIDECVPCYATMLSVPDTTLFGQMIEGRITGAVGPDGCYDLESIRQERVGKTWVLRPMARHHVPEHGGCSAMVVPLDETVSLEPRTIGWVYVVVLSGGPALLDSTFVNSQ
jgi:hypothetical protein